MKLPSEILGAAIGTRHIAVWNDDPERRVTQVRKAFRDAIKIAKAAGV